jgi:hypothetical protein
MAFLFSTASSFVIGALDGFKKNGVENKLYYGSAAITTGFGLMGIIGKASVSDEIKHMIIRQPMFTSIGICCAPIIVVGGIMLNASYMGKAIRDMHE